MPNGVGQMFAKTTYDKLKQRKEYLEENAKIVRIEHDPEYKKWSIEFEFSDKSCVEIQSKNGNITWAGK